MPETAVYEEGEFTPKKGEVGSSGQFLVIPSDLANSCGSERREKRVLRSGPLREVRLHALANARAS